jgi:zinc D-Ala-D-Ala carboxypeptidase
MRSNNVPSSAGAIRRCLLIGLFLLTGCAAGPFATPSADSTPSPVPAAPTATEPPIATVTVTPTAAPPTPTSTPSPTAFPLPTAGPIVSCAERKPAPDDLLPVVTNGFGLSQKFVPKDLVRLDKYLSYTVVYSPEIKIRLVAVEPLVKMIKAMQAAGLKPIIRSGYRGYYDQVASHTNWEQQNPARAGYVSAQPGHSEHQLGLALDFGSPELAAIVGDPAVQFHSDFDKTHEGQWLAEHAHEYGFSMSYPSDAYDWTGLIYEPWHFRYVGVELATYLYATGQYLTKFMMQAHPVLPCMP